MDNLVDGLAGHLGLTVAAAVGTAAIATTILPSLGALDPQGAATEVFAIQLLNHSIGNFLVVDVGEAESTGRSGFAIQNRFEPDSLSNTLEQSSQLLFVKGLRQVADVQADAHEGREMRFVGVGPSSLTPAKLITVRPDSDWSNGALPGVHRRGYATVRKLFPGVDASAALQAEGLE